MSTSAAQDGTEASQSSSVRAQPSKVATARKQPPPETANAIWTRRWVVVSFWAVVIFLGLPIWWRTTSIYRATLPLQTMHDWAEGKNCRPVFPLRIAIEAPSIPTENAQHLIRVTQHALDDLNEFSAHHLRLILSDPTTQNDPSKNKGRAGVGNDNDNEVADAAAEEDTALSVRLLASEGGSTPRAELQPFQSLMDVFYTPNQIPSTSSTSSPFATFLATELQSLFREEHAMLAHSLSPNSPSHASQLRSLTPEKVTALAKQSTRAFKYAPTYHLTFSLFTPGATPSDWAIESALKDFIDPLLDTLSVISNFTVDTQVQLYAAFSPSINQPIYDEGQAAWTLSTDDLSGFINAAEWPLSPSIGTGPTVNFILYAPSPEQSPLVVKENGGNSWLIPQWGGVFILNSETKSDSSNPSTTHLSKNDLRPAMYTFSNQLLSLLGLPESPASLPLRLSTLTRVRAASLLFSASSTIGALARLTQNLSSIAIPDTVAQSVGLTIHHLENACSALRDGRFASALHHGRIADTEAEKAFFDPSMVGMVYFPDEHKIAVYLPLLGPVAVPLVMAGVKEIKALLRAWRRPAA